MAVMVYEHKPESILEIYLCQAQGDTLYLSLVLKTWDCVMCWIYNNARMNYYIQL